MLAGQLAGVLRKVFRIGSSRGSKSRNKVTVGEPAVGSLLEYGARRVRRARSNPNFQCAPQGAHLFTANPLTTPITTTHE